MSEIELDRAFRAMWCESMTKSLDEMPSRKPQSETADVAEIQTDDDGFPLI